MRYCFCVFFAFTTIPLSGIDVAQASNMSSEADAVSELGQKITLTNEQINAAWPNLPNAKEIYGKDICLVIDLNYCGKQASSMNSLPDANSPTVIDLASTIVNCTTTVVDLMHGKILYNTPQIWLQYSDSVWILVPSKYVPAVSQPLSEQQTDASGISVGNTWAIGASANPADVAGSNPVMGVVTFGQWTTNTFGSPNTFTATDCLTMSTDSVCYQIAMVQSPSGRSLVMNLWDPHTLQLFTTPQTTWPSSISNGQLYNMYIKYNIYPTRWELWWNFTPIWLVTGDPCSQILTGNQANAVVESSSFNQYDFQGFSTNIGGYINGYPVAAIGYLFNGNWVPAYQGDPTMTGYTYIGGNSCPAWGFGVGSQAPPLTWGSLNIGESSSSRDKLTVGAGISRPGHGTMLWSSGTFS